MLPIRAAPGDNTPPRKELKVQGCGHERTSGAC